MKDISFWRIVALILFPVLLGEAVGLLTMRQHDPHSDHRPR